VTAKWDSDSNFIEVRSTNTLELELTEKVQSHPNDIIELRNPTSVYCGSIVIGCSDSTIMVATIAKDLSSL